MMIVCSECGKEYSNKSPVCIGCGCPTEVTERKLAYPFFNLENKEFYDKYCQLLASDNKYVWGFCPACNNDQIEQPLERAVKELNGNIPDNYEELLELGNHMHKCPTCGQELLLYYDMPFPRVYIGSNLSRDCEGIYPENYKYLFQTLYYISNDKFFHGCSYFGGRNDMILNLPIKHPLVVEEDWVVKISREREKYLNSTTSYIPSSSSSAVRCPKCGSTQIQMVNRKFSLLTGFATNKVDRVCMKCKTRF